MDPQHPRHTGPIHVRGCQAWAPFFCPASQWHLGELGVQSWKQRKEGSTFRVPLSDPEPLTPKPFYFSIISDLGKPWKKVSMNTHRLVTRLPFYHICSLSFSFHIYISFWTVWEYITAMIAFYLQILQWFFLKTKILSYINSTSIKIRKLTLLHYYYLISTPNKDLANCPIMPFVTPINYKVRPCTQLSRPCPFSLLLSDRPSVYLCLSRHGCGWRVQARE